jgi:hypothetical protein
MKRLTVTLPDRVHDQIVKHVPAGEVSAFVARAIEDEIFEFYLIPDRSHARETLSALKASTDGFPKMTMDEIREAKEWGRK